MNLLDAGCCPYCSGLLFKESYYFRCDRDHRFTSSFCPAGATVADRAPEEAPGPRAGGSLTLRVLWHADRNEIGREYTFVMGGEGEP